MRHVKHAPYLLLTRRTVLVVVLVRVAPGLRPHPAQRGDDGRCTLSRVGARGVRGVAAMGAVSGRKTDMVLSLLLHDHDAGRKIGFMQ